MAPQDASLSSWVSPDVNAKKCLTPLLEAPLLLFLLGAQSGCEKATSSTLFPSLVLIIPTYTVILLRSEFICSLRPLPVRIFSSTNMCGEAGLTSIRAPESWEKLQDPSAEGGLFQNGSQLRRCSALKWDFGWRPSYSVWRQCSLEQQVIVLGILEDPNKERIERENSNPWAHTFSFRNSRTSIPVAGGLSCFITCVFLAFALVSTSKAETVFCRLRVT